MWPRKCKMEREWPQGQRGGAEGPRSWAGPSGSEVRARGKGRLGISGRCGQRSEVRTCDPESALRRGGCRPASPGLRRVGRGPGRCDRTPWAGARVPPRPGRGPFTAGSLGAGADAGLAAEPGAGRPGAREDSLSAKAPRPGTGSLGGGCAGPAAPRELRSLPGRAVGRGSPRPGSRQLRKALCAGPATGLTVGRDRGLAARCGCRRRRGGRRGGRGGL